MKTIPAVCDISGDREDFPRLFQDHDVLTLFRPEPLSDGIDLAPEDWFIPFERERARDPDCGFRS
ncbi:hypothetical protein rerp_36420 [Rhodococcus erythropolis]|nr:hypothetical protein rerp_36420 [Rhodococcus erythropolis]